MNTDDTYMSVMQSLSIGAYPLADQATRRSVVECEFVEETESLILAERVENSLKLIGDPYLARIHSAAAKSFHLRDWGRIISDKLDIVGTFYQILSDRVRKGQSRRWNWRSLSGSWWNS